MSNTLKHWFTLKVYLLHTYSNTCNFLIPPIINIQLTSIHAYAHSPPATYIIHMNSCVHIPKVTYTHHSTFFIFLHPPAHCTPHPDTRDRTWHDNSLVKAAVGPVSTSEPRLLSWGWGQGWLVTSGCYVRILRKQPESPLRCRAHSTSVSSFVFWLLILWTSAPLNLCQKKQRDTLGCASMAERTRSHWRQNLSLTKCPHQRKKAARCCPQWRFGKVHYPPECLFCSVWVWEGVDAGIYRKEPLRDLGGRGWGHGRAGALWSWPHGSPTGPSPHGAGRNSQLMCENPQTVGAFKIVWPPAHCPVPLGCPSWPA